MFQEPDNSREVSLKLSEVLNDIGVNERMVLKRRRVNLVEEAMLNIKNKLQKSQYSVCRFGSQSEGTTTLGLKSDADELYCDSTRYVIQDRSELKPGMENLLMVRDKTTSPGYCLLQILNTDAPSPFHKSDLEHLTKGNRTIIGDKVFLKNTSLHFVAIQGSVTNGPAQSYMHQGRKGHIDHDLVQAYHCQSWPKEAREFRHVKGTWPTEEMRGYCETTGCFLVPVSSKSGINEETEWRISTSPAERCLMFSLNITQIRCYVLMKMIIKTIINPHCNGILSSFMCKTVLFHCINETNDDMWRQDNLLACTVCCIEKLKEFVEAEKCPHFIIPKNNLMARKFTSTNKETVLKILQDIIQNKERIFEKIETDDIGSRFKVKMKNGDDLQYTRMKSADEMQKLISANLLYNFAINVSATHKLLLRVHVKIPDITLEKILRTLFQTYIGIGVTFLEKSAIECLNPFFCSTFGSVMASKDIYMHHSLSKALEWFKYGLSSDVSSGKLKLASSVYCEGNLQFAEFILRCTLEKYDLKKAQPICSCNPCIIITRQEFVNKCDNGHEEVVKQITSFCATFLPSEIDCVPKELQYEMFRFTQQERLERDEEHDYWMDWAVVDSLPFIYFLQYKTYDTLRRNADKQHALANLVSTIETDKDLGHRETAWNLLGQCMEQENRPIDGLRCYVRSLNIRAKNNAAKILLCRLVSELANK